MPAAGLTFCHSVLHFVSKQCLILVQAKSKHEQYTANLVLGSPLRSSASQAQTVPSMASLYVANRFGRVAKAAYYFLDDNDDWLFNRSNFTAQCAVCADGCAWRRLRNRNATLDLLPAEKRPTAHVVDAFGGA